MFRHIFACPSIANIQGHVSRYDNCYRSRGRRARNRVTHERTASWEQLEWDHKRDESIWGGIDAPICQDKRVGGLRDVSAHAEVCHNTLVDFTGEEAFEAADDLASGPAASRPAGDVVDRRLVEPHADDDRAMEGGVRLLNRTGIFGDWIH